MPFIGFPFPSHTHDIVPFLLKLISKGLSETIAITELLEFNKFQVREQTETVTIDDSALTLQVFKQTQLAETVTVSEALARVNTKARALSQTVTSSESLARANIKARALAQTVTSSEVVNPDKIVPRAVAQTVTVSEALARPSLKARALSEAVSVNSSYYY